MNAVGTLAIDEARIITLGEKTALASDQGLGAGLHPDRQAKTFVLDGNAAGLLVVSAPHLGQRPAKPTASACFLVKADAKRCVKRKAG